jgi:predicted nucleic acid-binding protein
MRILADTSVLVPGIVEQHVFHERAFPWIYKARNSTVELCVSAHSLAESYSTLTNLPFIPRISPGVAKRLIRDNIEAVARVVELTRSDYLRVIDRAADLNIVGGTIYDALVTRAAEKVKVDKLLTFNVRHFRWVWPEGGDIIQEP